MAPQKDADPEMDLTADDEMDDPDWYRENETRVPCYKFGETGLYNLSALKNFDGDWNANAAGKEVSFNFCMYVNKASCSPGDSESFALEESGPGSCLQLTSDAQSAELVMNNSRDDPSSKDEQLGIRILRAGGSDCPEDPGRQMSFTVDIWCDADATGSPMGIEAGADPEDSVLDADPCNIYVSLEHSAGCVYYDFTNILRVAGTCMIFFGLMLMCCGRVKIEWFMAVLLRLATFVIVMTLFYKLHYFAYFDPSEPEERQQITLAIFAVIVAFIA
jgi:hypothetical protein